jgi:hypothetical protein
MREVLQSCFFGFCHNSGIPGATIGETPKQHNPPTKKQANQKSDYFQKQTEKVKANRSPECQSSFSMKKTIASVKAALKKRADNKRLKKGLAANDGALAKKVLQIVADDQNNRRPKAKPSLSQLR